MKKWNVYQHSNGDVVAVKEGFNWWAFFFVGLWAFSKRLMWAGAIGLSLTIAANRMPSTANIIALPMIAILMITYGFMGNGWVAAMLEKKGYARAKQLEAASEEGAKANYLRDRDLNPSNTQATQAVAPSSTPINYWMVGISVFLAIGIVAAIVISADEDMKKNLKVAQPSNTVPSAPKWEDLSVIPPPQKSNSKPSADSEGWTQESTGSSEVGPWLNYSPAGTRYCRYADRTIIRVYPPGVMPNAERANPFCLGISTEYVPQLTSADYFHGYRGSFSNDASKTPNPAVEGSFAMRLLAPSLLRRPHRKGSSSVPLFASFLAMTPLAQ